jgi:hypothetical protein
MPPNFAITVYRVLNHHSATIGGVRYLQFPF